MAIKQVLIINTILFISLFIILYIFKFLDRFVFRVCGASGFVALRGRVPSAGCAPSAGVEPQLSRFAEVMSLREVVSCCARGFVASRGVWSILSTAAKPPSLHRRCLILALGRHACTIGASPLTSHLVYRRFAPIYSPARGDLQGFSPIFRP